MPAYFPAITEEQAALIRAAPLFFVATVDPVLADGPHAIGPINLSPKGDVPLHIVSPNLVAFLDYSGSGNETARHSLAGGPITVMVCSFEAGEAAIVRLYGKARVSPLATSPLAASLLERCAQGLTSQPRHVIEIDVLRTMTSCGYGVPVMEFVRHRRVTDRGRRYKGSSYPQGKAKQPK